MMIEELTLASEIIFKSREVLGSLKKKIKSQDLNLNVWQMLWKALYSLLLCI